MKLLAHLLLILTSLSAFSRQQSQPEITGMPEWVVTLAPEYDAVIDEEEAVGGYYFLLVDLQESIASETTFRHFAVKILNSEGIQKMSDISVDFDPSYEELVFHKVQLIRDGQAIDKLNKRDIKTFQRETSLERHLYDGSLTAHINLTDVREGDIIEYAYSVQHFNPAFDGHFSRTYYFEYEVPVYYNQKRLLAPSDLALDFKYPEGKINPQTRTDGAYREYVWAKKDAKAILYDDNVPLWYDPAQRVVISDFRSWAAVADWAIEVYKLDSAVKDSIKNRVNEITSGSDIEEQIVSAIRFVQDEVRYLGFEDGMSGYIPHRPTKVLDQRFGDCKDKSLLLSTVLNTLGVEAYPVLVNSYSEKTFDGRLPAITAFNHCVVQINFEGKQIYVDPTINNQGGGLGSNYFPTYGKGLVVKKGTTDLVPLPEKSLAKTIIKEVYEIKEVGGPTAFKVISEYRGGDADSQRGIFSKNSRASIQKEYLNFYSAIYPKITTTSSLEVKDDREKNVFTVEETYRIDSLWLPSEEEDGVLQYETYPLDFETYAYVTNPPDRSMPYYQEYPLDYYHETLIKVPETWNVVNETQEITGKGFSYKYEAAYRSKEIKISHKYKTLGSYIPSEEFASFQADHDKIMENLGYYLTYQDDHSSDLFEDVDFSYDDLLTVSIMGALVFVGAVWGLMIWAIHKKR